MGIAYTSNLTFTAEFSGSLAILTYQFSNSAFSMLLLVLHSSIYKTFIKYQLLLGSSLDSSYIGTKQAESS